MLQEDIVIEVERRHETGKNASNRLRASAMVPAVIYGGGPDMETLSLSVPKLDLTNLFRKGIHENAVFMLRLKGTDQRRHVMIRDVSIHPVSRELQHVDFIRVLMDRKLRVQVKVECVGTPKGVKEGGILNVVTHQLAIECLPEDIPASIQVDVTELAARESLRVSGLTVDQKLRLLDAPDRVVVHISQHRAEEVAPVAAAEVVAPTGEPEVIKKGKKEAEEAAAKPEKKEKK